MQSLCIATNYCTFSLFNFFESNTIRCHASRQQRYYNIVATGKCFRCCSLLRSCFYGDYCVRICKTLERKFRLQLGKQVSFIVSIERKKIFYTSEPDSKNSPGSAYIFTEQRNLYRNRHFMNV